MTEGVKFAVPPTAVPAAEGGRSRREGDRGAFDILFRTAKHAKPDRAEGARSRQDAPALELPPRAKLATAIAATDGARRAGTKDVPQPVDDDAAIEGKDDPRTEQGEDPPAEVLVAGTPTGLPLADTPPVRLPVADTPPAMLPVAEAAADRPLVTEQPRAAGTKAGEPNVPIAARDDSRPAEASSPVAETQRGSPAVNSGVPPTAERQPPPAKALEIAPAALAKPARPVEAATVADPAQPPSSKPRAEAGLGETPADATSPVVAGTAEQALAGRHESGAGDAKQRRGGDGAAAAKVVVLSEQTIPAPAVAATTTASSLVAGLTGNSGWENSLRSVASAQHQANQLANAPLHSMKLQLHPAELGMVTANLRFSGGQLSVELTVENRDAYDRLTGDSETIVKSLRALGYEIDQVSVQQPQIANTASGRAESSFSPTGGSERNPQAFGSSGEGNGGEGLRGQAGGRGQPGGNGREEAHAQAAQDRAQRGLYI